MALTPQQLQLLKRELIRIQLNHESIKIDNLERVDLLGPPFKSHSDSEGTDERLPLLSFAFSKFLATFPLFRTADAKFWTKVCQPFVEGLAGRDISSSADRDQATKRRRAARGLRRLILMWNVAGINCDTTGVSTSLFDRKHRYESQAPGTGSSGLTNAEITNSFAVKDETLEVEENKLKQELFGMTATVIGVREIPATGFFGSTKYEFIVESQSNGGPPVWVARTYGDFGNLEKSLRQVLKGRQLPSLPLKNDTDTSVFSNNERRVLLRERQRTTLRHYLYRLCMLPKVAQSQIFLEFLSKSRIQELSEEEINDIKARIRLDQQRWNDRNKFVEIANERSAHLEKYLTEIKSAILQEDALPKLFLEMKEHSRVEEMSPLLQKLVEYSLVEIAAVLYQNLVARDDSPEIFAQIKRLHRMLPYTLMQATLKLSNPALVMKKLTDLFLVAPFGGRSLLQIMFLHVLEDDMKNLMTVLQELEQQINAENISAAISGFAWFSHDERELLHSRAELDDSDIVLEIVKSRREVPEAEKKYIQSCFEAWRGAVKGEADVPHDKVEYYSLLKEYHRACVRRRDKEVMQQFWSERGTLAFVKSIVDMMYNILIEIFRAPKISESFNDLKKFVNDLIAVVEHLDNGVELDANQMVNEFIALCRRHQNSIFKFINHVYAKDSGFFVDIVCWMTRFVNFVKAGKEGRNYLDLNAVISRTEAKMPDKFNAEELEQELEQINEWLLKRKQTASEEYNFDKFKEASEKPGRLDVSDVGLTWEDIDYAMAEVEMNEQIEFGQMAPDDPGQDAVTRERLRLAELKKHKKRQTELMGRPEPRNLYLLLPQFEVSLRETLRQADAHPSRIG